jgi:hypothetical protein
MKTYLPGPRNHRFFGVWTTPGAPETIPKGEVLRPPSFGMVVGPPGPPKPQISTISGLPKNHVSKTKVYTKPRNSYTDDRKSEQTRTTSG